MCIGQDVHGNIKLSLKATLRGPGGSETNDIAEGSAASAKETAKIWAPVWGASSITQEQNSASELSVEKNEVGKTNPSASETPVILIRSVEECDEKEKSISSNHNQTSNGPLVDNDVQLDHKSKSPSKSKPHKSQDAIDSPSHSGPLPYKNAKKPKL
jgi:polyribonucleotide nucleotidyltransferase